MPIARAHCTGVMPWRLVNSRNSLTLGAQWVVNGRFLATAASWLSRSRSAVQVSI
jgi:hypothetical protein